MRILVSGSILMKCLTFGRESGHPENMTGSVSPTGGISFGIYLHAMGEGGEELATWLTDEDAKHNMKLTFSPRLMLDGNVSRWLWTWNILGLPLEGQSPGSHVW